jgi:hypothetical protein
VPQAVGEPQRQAAFDQRIAADHQGGAAGNHGGGPARIQATRPGGLSRAAALSLGAGILAALLVAFAAMRLTRPAVIRALRRRARRRAPDPRRRTVGAWQDALESLGRSLGEPLDSLTAAEVGRRADVALIGAGSGERVLRLAQLAEVALFAPQSPHFGFSAQDAQAAWSEADSLRQSVNRSRFWTPRTPAG